MLCFWSVLEAQQSFNQTFASVPNFPNPKGRFQMLTSLIVRRKDNHNAPLITATPETVDLTVFDVIDEHGNPVGEEVLDEIRKLQAPPVEAKQHHAPAVPTHHATPVPPPVPTHSAPHVTTPPPHEPPKKK
jgi:hypothetical protein